MGAGGTGGLAGWLAAAISLTSVGGVIALVVAGILVATALVGSCPLYALFGLSTHRRGDRAARA